MGPFFVVYLWGDEVGWEGLKHFIAVTWFLYFTFLIIDGWLNDWVLAVAFTVFFCFFCFFVNPMRTLHTVMLQKNKQSSTWEMSWSVKLESLPRPSFCDLFWKVFWWTKPFPALEVFFVFFKDTVVRVDFIHKSPAFLMFPTMHTCLMFPLVS